MGRSPKSLIPTAKCLRILVTETILDELRFRLGRSSTCRSNSVRSVIAGRTGVRVEQLNSFHPGPREEGDIVKKPRSPQAGADDRGGACIHAYSSTPWKFESTAQ